MKRAGIVLLAGLMAFGCKKDAASRALVPPWQWSVTGMKPGSVAAEPALVVCEENGQSCAKVKPGVKLSGSKLLRLERGVSEFELDEQTRVEVAEGSELLLRDSPRTLEVRAGGISLTRAAPASQAGPLLVKLLDSSLELVGRASLVARLENLNRGQLFVSRGIVKATSPTSPAREFHPGEGALLSRAAPPDLQALFSGQISRLRQTVLAVAHPPPQPQQLPRRGLGTMTARAPGTSAVVGGVRLMRHHVKAVVRDGVAQTEVEEVFQNDTKQVLEGRYTFPLPADASIAGLALLVDDKLVEGELVEKERAAAIFKGIVDDTVRPRDPALLEWVRGSEFSLKVFPLPAGGSRKVVLRYQQSLVSDGPSQTYVYPLSFGAERRTPIDELAIDVELSDGGEAVQGVVPSGYPATVTAESGVTRVALRANSSAPEQDFSVAFRRARPGAVTGMAEQGFVAMRLRAELPPGAAALPFQRRDRVLVLDASQSQSAESFSAMKRLALAALRDLEPDERFALLLCDSACDAFPKSGLSALAGGALSEAEALLQARKPTGASDLAGALRAAVERVAPGAAGQVVYVGDGAASAGELSVPSIARRVKSSLQQRKVDLRLFGAGPSVDEVTLSALAQQLSGSYDPWLSSGSLEDQSEVLLSGLRVPLLLAPTLEVPSSVHELEPRVLPNLRLGEELVVIGKSESTLPFNVTLRGTLNGEPYALLRAVGVRQSAGTRPSVARSWAETRIRELQTSSDVSATSQIVALSKQFRVMSRATSWLVLENDRMFAEFGIPRSAPELLASAPAEQALARSELEQLDASASASDSSPPEPTKPSPPAKRAAAEEKASSAPPAASPAAPVGPGSAGGGIAGTGKGGALDDSSGTGVKAVGARGMATVTAPSLSGGAVPNAARVVAGMRAGFRNCYQRELAESSGVFGSLSFVVRIETSGSVSSAAATPSGNLPARLVSCARARAQTAQFDAPERSATLTFSVAFTLDPGAGTSPQPPGALTPRPQLVADVAVSRPGDEKWTQDGQAAIDKLQAELAAAPASRKKHEALVRGLLLRGRFVPALAAAERFVELDPELAAARELLAYAAVTNGDRGRASAAVDGLTENAPTDAKAQGRAARAFEALGDEVRACAHWRSLFELLPTTDAAAFEALRCRARVLGDRESALLDARAVSIPGTLLRRLLPLLESGQVPAFATSTGSPGQFEVKLSCTPANDCPYAVVITPTGSVFSPWTPALGRSSASSFAFSGLLSGAYRVLIVGGAAAAAGQVEVRALNARNTFSFGPGHARTLATTQVTLAPPR